MTMNQLVFFCKIAELEHFSKAAEILHISQPSLSYSMARLEEELGVKLFAKEGRNIALTTYGKVFHEYAMNSLTLLENGKTELKKMLEKANNEISIGTTTFMGMNYVPKLIKNYYALHPENTYSINMQQLQTIAIANSLKRGEIEIAFGPYFENDELEFFKLFSEPVVLAVPNNHRLANRTSVSFDDFSQEKMVTFLKPAGIRSQIDNYFLQNNSKPNILYEVTNELMVVGIAEAVSAVGLLPYSVNNNYQNLKMIPIRDCHMYRDSYAIRLKKTPLGPIAKEFWAFLKTQTQTEKKN